MRVCECVTICVSGVGWGVVVMVGVTVVPEPLFAATRAVHPIALLMHTRACACVDVDLRCWSRSGYSCPPGSVNDTAVPCTPGSFSTFAAATCTVREQALVSAANCLSVPSLGCSGIRVGVTPIDGRCGASRNVEFPTVREVCRALLCVSYEVDLHVCMCVPACSSLLAYHPVASRSSHTFFSPLSLSLAVVP